MPTCSIRPKWWRGLEGCFRHAPTVRTGRGPDKEAKILPGGRRQEALRASHLRAAPPRRDPAAIGLRPCFQDRPPRASSGAPAPVDPRPQPRLVAWRGAEPDLRPPRLEVAERRARADLAVGVLAGQPHLEVVRLLGTYPQVRRAEGHDAMVQSEPLQWRLRVANQLLQGRVRVLRTLEPDQLDLVELVLPDDPLRVLAVAARFAAEARRERGVLQWELGALEDLVAMIVRHRHFCGGDEVVTGSRLEEVLLELRQLPGAAHRVRVHQVGGQQLEVPALPRGIEEELHDRELEPCQGAAVEDETGPRHLRGAFEVEQAEFLADLDRKSTRLNSSHY